MITILLTILKIVGVILLVFLGLILLVLCLVLFAPVKYRAKGAKHPEEMHVSAFISYLRPFIRISVSYPQEPHLSVKIFWFDLLKPKEEKKDSQRKPENNKEKRKPAGKKKPEKQSTQKQPMEKQPVERQPVERQPVEKQLSTKQPTEEKVTAAEERVSPKAESVYPLETLREDSPPRKDTQKAESKEENKLAAIAALLWQYKEMYPDVLGRLFKALKTILPGKCNIYLVFGTGSPESTGYLYGAYCAFAEYLPGTIEFEPVWMESYLDVEFELSGKIRVIHFVTAAVKIIADKRVRQFISEIRRI
ncbi:MAG: hypothetical protein LUH19_05360 [Lachnospiraceae bacterium]|nr:hypothetical protein [Lachnospiraceae bacterium]